MSQTKYDICEWLRYEKHEYEDLLNNNEDTKVTHYAWRLCSDLINSITKFEIEDVVDFITETVLKEIQWLTTKGSVGQDELEVCYEILEKLYLDEENV